jgi:hypothetical protein
MNQLNTRDMEIIKPNYITERNLIQFHTCHITNSPYVLPGDYWAEQPQILA